MKLRNLARSLLRFLAALAVLAIVAVLDWYPTVKDLGRLRRERSDMERKAENHIVMASRFVFPDAVEKSLFAENNALLRRSLPQMYDNDAWLALAMLELQARVMEDRILHARFLLNSQIVTPELGTVGQGGVEILTGWIDRQFADIQGGFSIAFDPESFLWYGILSDPELSCGRLISRPVCVVAMAPLPALLDFVNHISWGEARLEIVRLHLEPGAVLSRAWLICRGNYLVRKPSHWAVKEAFGNAADDLLLDLDSELLWLPVDPEAAGLAAKKELAPGARAAATR